MYICRVQGKCVSTIKNKKLSGYSLVTMQKLDRNGKMTGDVLVAIDTIGCSIGETVLATSGENAKYALDTKDVPADTVIVGIIDKYESRQE